MTVATHMLPDGRRIVVAAAVEREGRLLAARRTRPESVAGGWELPGGKKLGEEVYPGGFGTGYVVPAPDNKTALVTTPDGKPVHYSIGLATLATPPRSVGEMIHAADTLMYSAKEKGKGWTETVKFRNPVTDQIQTRVNYIERVGDYAVGSGVFKD